MKRIAYLFVLFLLVSALIHSCVKEEEFDESLLIGRWETVSGPTVAERYRFMSDLDSNDRKRGYTWSPSVQLESENQAFTWQLKKSKLEITHTTEMGGIPIFEFVTITKLTATTLEYKDDYDKYSFKKVN